MTYVFVRFCLRYGFRGPRARNMNLVDLQRAAEQGRRGKSGTVPAGSVSNMRLDEALEWAAGALAKIQVCVPSGATRSTVLERRYILGVFW